MPVRPLSLLRNPLLALFLIGVVLIVLMRVVVSGLPGAFLALIVAILAVVGLAVVHVKSRSDLRIAGDEAYYLGLLFTLVSLIIALVQLFVLRSEDSPLQQRTQELIGNFGVALVSTVAGILARVLLQSASERSTGIEPRPDNGDLNSPEVGIGSDILALRREIRQAADALSHFRRMTFRHAEEAKAHTEALIRAFNEDMAHSSHNELAATAAVWRELADQIRQDHRRLARQSDELLSELGTHLNDAVRSQLNEAVQVWEAAGTELAKQGERLSNRFEAAATAAADRTAASWSRVVASLQRAADASRDRIEADAEEISSTLASLKAMQGTVDAIAAAMDRTATHLDSLGVKADAASTGLDARASQIVSAHKTLIREMDSLRESVLKDIREKLATERRQLTEEGAEWQRAIQQLTTDGRTQLVASAQNLDAAQRVNEQLGEHANRWAQVADQTNTSLISVVDKLTDIARKG